ncbi:C4-dicarboxylate ABC transporter [Dyella sp. 2RAB6]|uniref:SLAC1 family transporter n=1 Tax=Dyella sp. 2RAB6 TaxID=3232992 RepID=UPI003F92D625
MEAKDAGTAVPWPVGLFASVMGLAGLSVAWRLAARAGAAGWIGDGIAVLAWLVFLLLVGVQLQRAWRDGKAWRAELRHPATAPFLGTFWISLLLLPMLLPVGMPARAMWLAGCAGMLVCAWRNFLQWTAGTLEEGQVSAAWLIPVVGLLDIPLAFPLLGPPVLGEVMLFALAAGFVLAIPVFSLVFGRLVSRAPVAQPTLLILLAPFAVGFSAYVAMAGAVDALARSLFYLDLFLLAVLLPRVYSMLRGQPFRLSWWALSFPLAASAVAAQRYALAVPTMFSRAIAVALLALATVAIGALAWRSLRGLVRGEMLVPVATVR